MYVCICRAINEKKIKAAVDAGADRPAAVFRAHGCRPNCGACLTDMQSVIRDAAAGRKDGMQKAS